MNNLTRWDPFRDMVTLRSQMDRLFDSFFQQDSDTGLQPVNWSLPLDVSENNDEFVVKASIPGIKPDDLEITFNNNTLTIRGETQAENEKEEERYHLRERRFGKFARSLTFPTKVNGDRIQAHYDAGELTLHLPKAEEIKPKRISIQGGQSRMIEGELGNPKADNGKK